MTLSPNINNLEKGKFVESASGQTSVSVEIAEYLAGVVGNKIEVAYPSATTETYTYTDGVTTLKVITVTYTDSTKANLSSVERTA